MSLIRIIEISNAKKDPHYKEFFDAVKAGDIQKMAECIEKYDLNINLNASVRSNSALHIAAINEDIESMKFLLSKGAYINLKNVHGHTPFMSAIETNNLEVFDFLLENDADFTIKNCHGVNVITRASTRANSKTLKFLLEKLGNSMINDQDKHGNTALHYSTNLDNIEILMKNHANPFIKNKNMENAIDYSAKNTREQDKIDIIKAYAKDEAHYQNKDLYYLNHETNDESFDIDEITIEFHKYHNLEWI